MRWDLHPELVSLGGLPSFRWYGLAITLGWTCAILAFAQYAERDGGEPRHVTATIFWTILAAFIGGHLGHLALYEPYSLENPLRVIEIGSGQASHGAVVAATFAVWLHAYARGEDARRYLDAAASGAVFLVPFQRLGNFASSEIVGRPWDGPWAVSFPRYDCPEYFLTPEIPAGLCDTIPRHPAQLYEALFGLALIGAVLHAQARWARRLRPGALALGVAAVYFAGRLLLELTYDYQVVGPESSPLTMGQWASVPLFAMPFLCILVVRSKLLRPPRDAIPE